VLAVSAGGIGLGIGWLHRLTVSAGGVGWRRRLAVSAGGFG